MASTRTPPVIGSSLVVPRSLAAFVVALAVFPCQAEQRADTARTKSQSISDKEFNARTITIPGQGRIHGFEPWRFGASVRSIAADDSAFATLEWDDARWPKPKDLDSLVELNAPVYWVRFHFSLDSSLSDGVITTRIQLPGSAELWMDGKRLLESTIDQEVVTREPGIVVDSTTMLEFQLAGLSRGTPHVLAVRVTPNGKRNALRHLEIWFYRPNAIPELHRQAMHNGLFIGVNGFMLLLALIFWRMDRQDRVWPWFAALLAANTFSAFTDLLDLMTLGIPERLRDALTDVGFYMSPVPITLSVMILLVVLGRDARKKMLFYAGAGILMCALLVLAKFVANNNLGSLKLFDWKVLAVLILIWLIAIVGFIWLLVDAVRYGWRAFRSRGFIKRIGAGVLLSLLAPAIPIIAVVISAFAHGGENAAPSTELTTTMRYVSNIAVPLSIIVSLAIRSSFQNRLLARQRDDLDKEVHERTAELRLERDRSEELLLNILPQEVATELKQKGSAEARHFDLATVLFSDFKGFTEMSGSVPPAELLQELNACFKAFDDIIGARGIEKIKTIGDAYMCAAGLPDPKNASPPDVVLAALEMQAFMKARKAEREGQGLFAFEMRLGIHSGPVVAGIVGVKKFQYDIWGDTVNMASRMETNGEVGRVNLSADTYELVKNVDGLRFTSRGAISVKGKGATDMWFVDHA